MTFLRTFEIVTFDRFVECADALSKAIVFERILAAQKSSAFPIAVVSVSLEIFFLERHLFYATIKCLSSIIPFYALCYLEP